LRKYTTDNDISEVSTEELVPVQVTSFSKC
jgi:hypothetical protein